MTVNLLVESAYDKRWGPRERTFFTAAQSVYFVI
jgi:hypothetical protein